MVLLEILSKKRGDEGHSWVAIVKVTYAVPPGNHVIFKNLSIFLHGKTKYFRNLNKIITFRLE